MRITEKSMGKKIKGEFILAHTKKIGYPCLRSLQIMENHAFLKHFVPV